MIKSITLFDKKENKFLKVLENQKQMILFFLLLFFDES